MNTDPQPKNAPHNTSPQHPAPPAIPHDAKRPAKPHGKSPRSSTPEQRQSAQRWLERLGLPVTNGQVNLLAPYAEFYRPDSPWLRIADAMVRNGEEPKPALVRARHETRKQAARASQERRRQRALEQGAHPERNPELIATLQRWLASYHSEHGHGPRWSEVRTRMGWSRIETEAVLHALRERGEVTFTHETGSLAPAQHR